MRILLLTHRIPYPPNKGDKIRAFHILEHLRNKHRIHLATLIDDRADLEHLSAVHHRAQSVAHARIDGRLRKLLSLFALLGKDTVTVRHFYSRALQAQLDELMDKIEFDAVICSSSPMARYLFESRHWNGRLATALKIMDFIDVDSYKWRQYAENARVWSAWVYRREAQRLADFERRIYRAFDCMLVASEVEKRYFPVQVSDGKLQAMVNGVDLDFFVPSQREPRQTQGPTIVFTGTMDYWPNVDGMRWFIERVYPEIRRVLPDVSLFVVGNRPTAAIRRYDGKDRVVVTGYVADVREFLESADVCVVPLRVARGVQNKLLEAMAMGKPVVTTPQGLEGLGAVPGKDLTVADSEAAFAAAVVDLLRDRAKAVRLGTQAREYVHRHHRWEDTLAPLDEALVRRGGGRAAG